MDDKEEICCTIGEKRGHSEFLNLRAKCRKASLDISWLRDESLEESDNLPDPDVLGAETLFHSNTW